MKKNTLLAFGMVITTVLLSSCNGMPKEIKADEVKEETIYMRSDGSSQVAYVEDFSEKYLNLDELKGYISSELSSYNKKYGDKAAVLSEIELKSGKVKAVLTFKSSEIYEAFNSKKGENNARFLKADKALSEFGELSFIEADSDAGKKKAAGEALSDEYNIAVVKGPVLFQTGDKIKYYSGGNLYDSHHIRVDEGKEAVVVYSK
mgnify:FL=1